jgi:hypothetical protein
MSFGEGGIGRGEEKIRKMGFKKEGRQDKEEIEFS